jgi:protein-tyrosine phosphatase
LLDLHCHILPGLDDGSPDLEASVEMARTARAAGIQTIAATPHVNNTYPTEPDAIAQAIGTVNVELARRDVPVAVLPGAEIAIERLGGLTDGELRRLTLGGGDCLLIETPYTDTVPFLEETLFDLQVRGFRPLLGHPERSRAFRDRPERLIPIVERGVATCINSASLAGDFGANARRVALDLLRRGLVNVVASDSHDSFHRPPSLLPGLEAADEELPGILAQADYFTCDAPFALLNGTKLPPAPDPPQPPPTTGWRRFLSGGRAAT